MKIIAETASNHMGQIEYLKELTLKCHTAGANYITVQIFDLDSFVSKSDKKSFENFSKIHISQNKWVDYFKFCKDKRIEILPCILDEKSAEMCCNSNFKEVKLHASDILNYKFLNTANKRFNTVFLEFGGASLFEIKQAVHILNNVDIILMYGFNAYPTKLENQNLNFISTLKYIFKTEIGFCDHSLETHTIPLLAMAKGAAFLEKHVTLNKQDKNRFDWDVSIEPNELYTLCEQIKKYQPSLGDMLRELSEDEQNFRKIVYKKIVANRDIISGEIISQDILSYKRSIKGIELSKLKSIIGKKVNANIRKDEPIGYEKLSEKK